MTDQGGLRVVRVDYGSCVVASTQGLQSARTAQPVAVGDWVTLTEDEPPHVSEVAERSTEVTRRDSRGLLQVLAANVDIVLIAVPADRPSMNRAEREVTIAWDSGATPVVLLTKSDLDDGTVAAELRERLIGVDVVAVSSMDEEGVLPVRQLLMPDRTAVLLGPSGAGKSTLVNALVGHEVAATSDVREADHRGRHTTTVRELHVIPTGGFLIDTPGLRSLSLAADEEALQATFPDITELSADCKFRDCTHEHEPGCAVTEAVAAGMMRADRLESYHKLRRDLAYQLRKDDPLAAREHEALWRQRAKEIRRLFRDR